MRPDEVSIGGLDAAAPPFAAYRGASAYVFVSYAHADRVEVYRELVQLRTAGFNIWYDEGITPGSEWTDELADAIRGCQRFLLYVSPASIGSRNCRDEIQFAVKHDKPVLPVYLAPTELPAGIALANGAAIHKYSLGAAEYEGQLVAALQRPIDTRRRTAVSSHKRRWFTVGLVLLTLVASLAYWLAATSKPRITAYTPLTKSQGDRFSPAVSPYPIATDGPRVYFVGWDNGAISLRQVSIRGGESTPLNEPFKNPFITGITPDRAELVVAGEHPKKKGTIRWLWPPTGGTPRELGIDAHDVNWSNDGKLMVYGSNEISVADGDGSHARMIIDDAPGTVAWIRVSADNSRIRFTAMNDGTFSTLWEASIDGTNLHQLLPGWNNPPNECCGSWTPDGKYYVFQANRGGRLQLWALREDSWLPGASTEPIELTSRTLDFVQPTFSPDGHKLIAMGWNLTGEVTRYDVTAKQWIPHSVNRSVEWLSYSRDGQWIAYVTYPTAELWRSRVDGTDALKLASPPTYANAPVWSPDGTSIAFQDQRQRILLVPSDGSAAPRRLSHGERTECCATWSPDGRRLVLSTDSGIRLIDRDSGEESALVGSESLRQPMWWLDGRYVTAISPTGEIKRFDFDIRGWKTIGHAKQPWYHIPSSDGQYLWIVSGEGLRFSRMRVADGHVEQIASLADQPWAWGVIGTWMGIAPDGSPLYLRDASIYQIYALDWETPGLF